MLATVQEQRFSIIIHNGIKSNNTKVKAVQEYPQPKSAEYIKVHYQNHMQDLKIMIRPLTEFTRIDKSTGKTIIAISVVRGLSKGSYFLKSKTIFQLH